MPRSGQGVYSLPAGSAFVPNTTIESSKVNAVNNDIVADLNAARPITAGGTGATTAVAGADNLSTKGTDIASAATTDIGAATGRFVHITGTATITSLGSKTAGVVRILTFDGALILTHNASTLILPGAANILTAAGDTAVFVSEGGGWRCVSYTKASGSAITTPSQGFLFGLTLSNNSTDATNDIDISVGQAAADTSPYSVMVSSSILTKRLDAAWAVGSGNGGLDTGSIANTTYHIWLIQRSDTGVVDALFSTSATSPTMPTNYDRKRRIGSIIRESAAIVSFTQDGDIFKRASKLDYNSATARASALLTLSVPLGVGVYPMLTELLSTVTTNTTAINTIGSAVTGSADITVGQVNLGGTSGVSVDVGQIPAWFKTNTSAQLYFSVSVIGTVQTNQITTVGWIDTRGKV